MLFLGCILVDVLTEKTWINIFCNFIPWTFTSLFMFIRSISTFKNISFLYTRFKFVRNNTYDTAFHRWQNIIKKPKKITSTKIIKKRERKIHTIIEKCNILRALYLSKYFGKFVDYIRITGREYLRVLIQIKAKPLVEIRTQPRISPHTTIWVYLVI